MSGRTIGIKALRILIVALVIALIGYQSGAWDERKPEGADAFADLLEPAREIFPEAEFIVPGEICPKVLDSQDKLIGYVFDSHDIPETLDVIGYAGPIPVLVGITLEQRVAGIAVLPNSETPAYIHHIRKHGFFSRWDDIELSRVDDHHVDTITGATMSTSAIIDTVRHCAAKLANEPPPPPPTFADALTPAFYAMLGIIFVGLVSWSFPKQMGWLRPLVMICSIGVMGFWTVTMVSLSQLNGWIVNGIPWVDQPMVILIVAIAFIIPFLTGKSFYCTHLCPYGACQEIVNKLPTKKYNLPKPFRYVRISILSGVAFALILKLEFDPAMISPFTAFQMKTASVLVLVIAVAGLLASLFLRRPWCNYFCPVGALVDQFRKGAKPKKVPLTETAPPEERNDGC